MEGGKGILALFSYLLFVVVGIEPRALPMLSTLPPQITLTQPSLIAVYSMTQPLLSSLSNLKLFSPSTWRLEYLGP